ncbi:MAG: dihydrolipoyl dehydrogenase [Paludibacteraceae bacterium]|nr:dihydrolipoyl dehydrogenase [Paludibacteraceae bacterium]
MQYFLAIIGGGPAGYTAAEKASKAGKDVVLFEQNAVGGTCLNVGCIPTKSLLYGAKQYYNATHAQKYGVTAADVSFDFVAMQKRKTIVVRKLVAGIKQRLNNEHCTLVSGAAKVMSQQPTANGQWQIECNGETYEAENLLICTGSTNFVPPIPGIQDNPAVWDSTDALAATELPKSIIIVGGGVIGMEFATLYHELGVPVTVIEAMPTILPNLDQDVVSVLMDKYRKAGINILTSTKVESIDGQKLIANGQELTADKILVSVGRRANLQGLEALKELELVRGAIKVDDLMKTNLPNVYAAGDVTGKIMLAHVASAQAEVVVNYLLSTSNLPTSLNSQLSTLNYSAIPSVVYTNPEIASVGITETQAAELNITPEVRKLPMTFSGRFMAENEGETGLCKVVIDSKTQMVLGVHMIGNPCSEFIAAASFAVRNGYTVPQFQQVVFPHPTVSEILHEIMG